MPATDQTEILQPLAKATFAGCPLHRAINDPTGSHARRHERRLTSAYIYTSLHCLAAVNAFTAKTACCSVAFV